MENKRFLIKINAVFSIIAILLIVAYLFISKTKMLMEIALILLGAINIINGVIQTIDKNKWKGITFMVAGILIALSGLYTLLTRLSN